MTFCVRSLIIAAGGEFRAGMKLKSYFWSLCEDLVLQTDTKIQPRTLEVAWREGVLSKRVKAALEKLANEKLKATAKDHDLQFIADCKQWIETARKHDSLFPQEELAMAGAFVSFLDRIAAARGAIARTQSALEITRAALAEERRERKIAKRRRG